jgi:ketosteroid isomerase-like protein
MSESELETTAHEWDRAMLANDATLIGSFMADDWTIVGPDGSVNGKAPFLALIASGDLTHDRMTSEDLSIRIYGDTAIVIASGESGGHFKGRAFHARERASNVFVRTEGRWRCVLTHLSTLA